jgi:hypothetical protein
MKVALRIVAGSNGGKRKSKGIDGNDRWTRQFRKVVVPPGNVWTVLTSGRS